MRLLGSWRRVVKPRVLKNARPVRFRHGVLTVHTSTSAWADALSMECEGILGKLRVHVPGLKVRRIMFRTGRLPELREQYREPRRPPLMPLDQLPEELARELARVAHDGLRDAIHTAASATLGREKQPLMPGDVALDDED